MAWEKGMAKNASRSDRENSEGVVVARVDGQTAAVVELKCETDFVAKSEQFGEMADKILTAVLANGEDAVSETSDELEDLKITLKEKH